MKNHVCVNQTTKVAKCPTVLAFLGNCRISFPWKQIRPVPKECWFTFQGMPPRYQYNDTREGKAMTIRCDDDSM
jgi:hypothetical protein